MVQDSLSFWDCYPLSNSLSEIAVHSVDTVIRFNVQYNHTRDNRHYGPVCPASGGIGSLRERSMSPYCTVLCSVVFILELNYFVFTCS